MPLQAEIDKKVKEIQTDSYPMSIGELINMYKDKELEIHPEFQRFFRWSSAQKARFIESILLGIPIPPIFVAQGKGGVWDVIDGLQRLSTIFEFIGILKSEEDEIKQPSKMQATKFLPSLENKVWDNPYDEESSFTSEQRINFKRSKLDINIIKKTSDGDAKYELFQRINTGGTKLSDQELRNCLLIMLDKDFYSWSKDLSEFEPFVSCIPLSEKQHLEQYDMEIIMRFTVYRHTDTDKIAGNEDMGDFITDQLVKIIEAKDFDRAKEKEVFEKTFTYLDDLLSENSFKKYNTNKETFDGAFLISAFEAIIVGISENIDSILNEDKEKIEELIRKIYSSDDYIKSTARGIRPINRFKRLTINSRKIFG